MRTIFVSIASYMDSELESTVNDMLLKARHPSLIVIGMCIQDTPDMIEHYKEVFYGSQYRITYIPHDESKGCCWARRIVQTMYKEEDYYMQIDAHHRFVEHWDSKCVAMLGWCAATEQVRDNKCMLTTYATPYELDTDTGDNGDTAILGEAYPYYMHCEQINDVRKVKYVPEMITNNPPCPQLWHTVSAHFIFTIGEWIKEVPYDEKLYFEGEEDSLAIRSWTRCWEMFYPHEVVLYHYYTRKGAPRHFEHDAEWDVKDTESKERLISLVDNTDGMGIYGVGNERTLDEYERFCGIDYINCEIRNDSVIHGVIPPEDYGEIITFGNVQFIHSKSNALLWNEVCDNPQYWCKFTQIERDCTFYFLYDSDRSTLVKVAIDGSVALICTDGYKIDGIFTNLFEETKYTVHHKKQGAKILLVSNGMNDKHIALNRRYAIKNGYTYIHYNQEACMELDELNVHLDDAGDDSCIVLVYFNTDYVPKKNALSVKMYIKSNKLKIRDNIYEYEDGEVILMHRDASCVTQMSTPLVFEKKTNNV